MRPARLFALALALAALAAAPAARADGDPASDVLYTQNVFLPYAEGVPDALAAELTNQVLKANKSGYRIKVAVIASRGDLGLVQGLWLKPKLYGPFLGRELRFLFRETLVIVMPNGFGVYHDEKSVAPEERLLAGVKIGSGAKGLTESMLTGVQRLAAAAGHPLPAPASGGSQLLDRFLIGGGALVVLIVLGVFGRQGRRRRLARLGAER